jgi:hypothetical protein
MTTHYDTANGFAADTRVQLVDGSQPTLAELTRRPADEVFQVWSLDGDGSLVVGEARSARVVGHHRHVIGLEFDHNLGAHWRCTPDQRFLLKVVGSWWTVFRPGSPPEPVAPPQRELWVAARELDLQALTVYYGDPADVADNMILNHLGGNTVVFDEPVDVYNLTVEPHHNFVLAGCGCFVRDA